MTVKPTCIRLITLSISISLCFGINAQTIQKGKVLLQNSGWKTLPGVQVTAYGAQPADTDNDGIFSLNFGNARPGDMTPLKEAYKKGFELVNRSELDKWILSGEKEMPVVMCPAGTLQTAREKYYDIGNSAYMKRYEQALKDIEHQKETNCLNEQGYADKLEEAYNELDNSLNRLRDYSDIFSRINRDEFSELETNVFRLLDEGKLDEAIQFYENEKLTDKLQQQISIKETAQQEIADMTASLKRYADICIFAGGKENLDKASQIYESLALANPDDYQSQFDYGKFLHSIVKYGESIEWLQKALKCTNNKRLIAETQKEIGEVYTLNRDFELSTASLERSAEIYKAEAKNNPQYYMNIVENILFICQNYFYQEKYKELMSLLKNAEKYLKQCDNKESSTYMRINNSITHFNAIGRYRWCLSSINADTVGMNYFYAESIRQSEVRLKLDSANTVKDYSDVLHNAARYYTEHTHDYTTAELCYLKAINIIKNIYNKNPFQGNVELSLIYLGMAQLYDKTGKYEQAREYYLEAYKLRDELAKNNSNAFLPNLGNALQDLGMFELEQHNYNEAYIYLIKGLEIGEQLYRKDPSANLTLLFSIYTLMGQLIETKCNNEPITEHTPDSYYLKAEKIIMRHPEYNLNSHIYILMALSNYYEKTDSVKYGEYLEKYQSRVIEQLFSHDDIEKKLIYYGDMAVEADSKGKHIMTDVLYKLAYTTMSQALAGKIKINNELVTGTAWFAGNHFFERNDIESAEKCYELYRAFCTEKFSEESALFRLNVFAKLKYIYELTDKTAKLQSLKNDIDNAFDYLGRKNVYKKPINLIALGLLFNKDFPVADLFFSGLFFDRAFSLMNFKNTESKDFLKEILILCRETDEYLNGRTNESLTTPFENLRTKLFGSIDNYASEGINKIDYIYYIMQFAALFHQNDDFAYSLKCIDKAFVYLDKRKDSNDPLDLIICGLMFSENFPAADSFFDRALNLMNFKNHENKNHLKEILVLYREIEEYLNSHTNESLTAQFNGLQTKLFVSIGDYASEGMDEAEYIYYIMQPAALFYQNDDFAFALKCMDSYIKRPLIVSEATTNKLVSNVPALKVLAVIYRENKMNKECIDILNTLESIYISLTERTGEKYGEDLELTKSIKQEVNEAIK